MNNYLRSILQFILIIHNSSDTPFFTKTSIGVFCGTLTFIEEIEATGTLSAAGLRAFYGSYSVYLQAARNTTDEKELETLTAGAILQFLIINGINPRGGRAALIQEKEFIINSIEQLLLKNKGAYACFHETVYNSALCYLDEITSQQGCQ